MARNNQFPAFRLEFISTIHRDAMEGCTSIVRQIKKWIIAIKFISSGIAFIFFKSSPRWFSIILEYLIGSSICFFKKNSDYFKIFFIHCKFYLSLRLPSIFFYYLTGDNLLSGVIIKHLEIFHYSHSN